MRRARGVAVAGWVLVALVALPAVAHAQYFGRNKVQYRTFDFQILKTDHFDLYYYPEEAGGRRDRVAAWRSAGTRGSRGSSITSCAAGRSSILYAAPAHFRQTNAVEGLIGEGTGGVTEALKRRIVLPMSGSLADTDHVIGHELVHAFQFDMTGADPRESQTSVPGILAYPLWFVEGMAEYLSLGPVDRADGDVDARRRAAREAAEHSRPRQPEVLSVPLGPRVLGVHRREVRRSDGGVAGAIGRQSALRPGRARAAARHRSRHADGRLARRDPRGPPRPLPTRTRRSTSASRRLIAKDTGSGRYNVGPRLSPDGTQRGVLLRARSVLDRAVSGRRGDRARSSAS